MTVRTETIVTATDSTGETVRFGLLAEPKDDQEYIISQKDDVWFTPANAEQFFVACLRMVQGG